MTIERKLLIGLEDIKAVCFECLNADCKSRAVVAAGSKLEIPEKCPACHAVWRKTEDRPQTTPEKKPMTTAFEDFVSSFKDVKTVMEKGTTPGFRILFEIEDIAR